MHPEWRTSTHAVLLLLQQQSSRRRKGSEREREYEMRREEERGRERGETRWRCVRQQKQQQKPFGRCISFLATLCSSFFLLLPLASCMASISAVHTVRMAEDKRSEEKCGSGNKFQYTLRKERREKGKSCKRALIVSLSLTHFLLASSSLLLTPLSLTRTLALPAAPVCVPACVSLVDDSILSPQSIDSLSRCRRRCCHCSPLSPFPWYSHALSLLLSCLSLSTLAALLVTISLLLSSLCCCLDSVLLLHSRCLGAWVCVCQRTSLSLLCMSPSNEGRENEDKDRIA